jgi:hypothetical protein
LTAFKKKLPFRTTKRRRFNRATKFKTEKTANAQKRAVAEMRIEFANMEERQ